MGPERGQVRVLSPDGALWGAGVLVAPRGTTAHVLTCAHVVTAALGGPCGELVVDLPGRAWSAPARPLAEGWSPTPPPGEPAPGAALADSGDFAVLVLGAGHPHLPRGCGPLPLAPCGIPDDRRVAVIGYPRGAPAGLIATARVTGGGGPCPEWVQLDGLRTTGAVVERGFSGAAVWDPVRRRVIGLITAAHTNRTVKVAWMLPVEAAVRLWPPLAGAVRPPIPRPCTPPTVEQQYQLADALLDVPQIGYDSGRTLRDALPPAVRRNIPDHPWPRQQLQALVRTCADHQDGCPALRAAVLNLGGDSVSARAAVDILDRICCVGESGSEGGA
ncbi:effector-associated domain 2-containing protein [Actinacidiphila soli]|uniref:effector-associated domain 2-containing protein n=1 Tax=Actinacidiphila soli TaxID=2487275 RepID=UPI002AFF86D9|nr:trypsin-like peptidase domain-containing protein [Actinacidiphila soli]